MNDSNVVNFSVLKSPEQIDAVITELNNYKIRMITETMTENCRKEVDEQMESFLRFCEAGDRIVYLFIPEEAIKNRVTYTVDDIEGYLFSLDSDTLNDIIIDDTNNIVCVMSELN